LFGSWLRLGNGSLLFDESELKLEVVPFLAELVTFFAVPFIPLDIILEFIALFAKVSFPPCEISALGAKECELAEGRFAFVPFVVELCPEPSFVCEGCVECVLGKFDNLPPRDEFCRPNIAPCRMPA
jgi:hypothetical protein